VTEELLARAKETVAKLQPRLNEQQKKAAELALAGRNVFFTGSAGSGKSLLLTYVVALLRARGLEEGSVACVDDL
jgi:pantothenate kinase-related protein Tda10